MLVVDSLLSISISGSFSVPLSVLVSARSQYSHLQETHKGDRMIYANIFSTILKHIDTTTTKNGEIIAIVLFSQSNFPICIKDGKKKQFHRIVLGKICDFVPSILNSWEMLD